MISDFLDVRERLFAFGCGQLLAKLWRSIEGIACRPEVIGMMVPVNLIKLLRRHAEIFRSLPFRRAELHQPSRRCVPHHVRRGPWKTSRAGYSAEGSIHILDWFAVPFDHISLP